MNVEQQITSLQKQILEAKLTEPTNFRKIQKLQQELDKLHEDRSSAT